MPVAPPAPDHARLAVQQAAEYNSQNAQYNVIGSEGNYEDGQYDPRYNDPSFEGNSRGAAVPSSYNIQPQPQHQPQYVPQQQQQQQQPAQPQYNHNINHVNYVAQYQSTTPNPHRFQPPGKNVLQKISYKKRILPSSQNKLRTCTSFLF